MTPESEAALQVLRGMARGHAGASSGESAAWEILQNFREGKPVNFADCFVRLDGTGKRAVLRLLLDLSTGGTGLLDLG